MLVIDRDVRGVSTLVANKLPHLTCNQSVASGRDIRKHSDLRSGL